MSDFLRLAQPGYDVHTAGDENLIYDSRWPLLKIFKQGSFKTDDVTQTSVIFDHNLGYVPFFWYFANTPINAWANFGDVGTQERSEFMGPIGGGNIEASDKQLKFNASGAGGTGKAQLYYYVFALDITKPYIAPIIKTGAVRGQRGDRVFKIAKENKDIKSNDLFDFIIHSRARSPLIHSVTPSKGEVKSLTVDHNLGYQPMFFGFQKTTTGYKNIYTGQGGSSSFQSSETQVIFSSTGALEISIVVLKDPFLVDYSVQVNI